MNRQERRAAERQARSDPAAGARLAEQAFAGAEQMRQAGRADEAEALCRQALSHDPRHGPSLNLLGILSLNAGRLVQAVDFFGRAVAAHGQVHTFHNNLGSALRQMGKDAEAAAAFRGALARKPDYARALINLGQTLSPTDPAAAADSYRRALAVAPGDVETLWALAVLLHQGGVLDEARGLYERALAIAPNAPVLLENLTSLLFAQGRVSEAIPILQRSLRLNPQSVDHWLYLGGALHGEARLTEAAQAYREAILRQPNAARAHNGLGNALANLGQLDASVAAYRRAVALEPDYFESRSNLLMTLHSLPQVTAAEILDEAKAYGARLPRRAATAFSNGADPERRLRIGYVSADLREHPVGFFLDRVLAAHDGGQFETVLYSDSAYADAQTARLQSLAGDWRTIAGKSDEEAARQIAADRIDILIDLAGHTGSNRLALFGARAAPVQASWLGYFGTTGVPAMDYVIADAVVLPFGEEPLFTEQAVRLPSPYLCWAPPRVAVEPAAFPALGGGPVTFGCFNNRAKITDKVVAVWAKILQRVEGSRLFLKSWSLADQGNRDGLIGAFATHGTAADRLFFEGLSSREEGLAAYNRVDIALDPFPFGGCTTTADTLWMGAPLVTLAGRRWSGRMSAAILSSVGLQNWVAPDLDAYVELAVDAAGDLAALAPLRRGLRDRVEQSPFCDGPAFTANLEAAYRKMWRAWCAS